MFAKEPNEEVQTYNLRIPALKEWIKEKQVRIDRKKINDVTKTNERVLQGARHKNKFTKKHKDEKYPLTFFFFNRQGSCWQLL